MLSYTTLRTIYGTDLTNDSSANNLSLGTRQMNEYIKRICSLKPWGFLEKTRSLSQVADQQFYELPNDLQKIESVYVTVGTTRVTPSLIIDREKWDDLNSGSSSGNTPQFYYLYGNQIGFWPTPSANAASAITISYRRKALDLSLEDYNTGTITTATAGDETIVASGSSFTSAMIGRFIRITPSDVVANSGDGLWYEIASVTNGTTLELVKPYLGASISGGGAAYTIGQMPVLPEEFHMLPAYYAAGVYYSTKKLDLARAKEFKAEAVSMFNELNLAYGNKSSNPVLDSENDSFENPNNYPTDLS